MGKREHGLRIGVLIAIVILAHTWLIATSYSLAPDTLRFIQFVTRMRETGVAAAITREVQHPLYPLALGTIEPLVRQFVHAPQTEIWRLAAQLTSSLCGVMLVVPLYGLVLESYHARAAWWATFLFVLLPVPNRILADGLSDGMHLLWVACCLWAATAGLVRRRPAYLSLAGAAAGLAFWTRPEGVLAIVVVMAVLVAMQFSRHRWPIRLWLVGLVSACVTTTAVVAPYVALKDGWISSKISFRVMVGLSTRSEPASASNPRRADATTSAMERAPLSSPIQPSATGLPAAMSTDDGGARLLPPHPWLRAAHELVDEFLDVGHYVTVLLVIAAWFDPWASPGRRPAVWLFGLLGTTIAVLLLRMHCATGYLASRHTLIPLLAVLPWAGNCLSRIEDVVAERLSVWARHWPVHANWRPLAAAVVFIGILGFCVPKLSQPLHRSRWGNRQAARWLAVRCGGESAVLDPHALAGFYARCRVYTGREVGRAIRDSNLRYVVVDTLDLQRRDGPYQQLNELVQRLGAPVARFPLYAHDAVPGILIYDARRVVAKQTAGHADAAARAQQTAAPDAAVTR